MELAIEDGLQTKQTGRLKGLLSGSRGTYGDCISHYPKIRDNYREYQKYTPIFFANGKFNILDSRKKIENL